MSKDLIVAPSALESVPGSDANGLTVTSKVAFVAFSAASLTSIGPDTDARTWTSSIEDGYQPTRCTRISKWRTKSKTRRAVHSGEQLVLDGNPTSTILVGMVDPIGGRVCHHDDLVMSDATERFLPLSSRSSDATPTPTLLSSAPNVMRTDRGLTWLR